MKHSIIQPFHGQSKTFIKPFPYAIAMTPGRTLTGKQTRFLRSLGHHLRPVVMVGKEGISEQVLEAIERNLEVHELIKVRVQEGAPQPARLSAQILADRTGSTVAQVIGKTVLLFRENEKEDRKIMLP